MEVLPTTFGILLLSFVLFNVVGGSPAEVVLGKDATAETIPGFNHIWGYDKPLVVGSLSPFFLQRDHQCFGGVLFQEREEGGEHLALPVALLESIAVVETQFAIPFAQPDVEGTDAGLQLGSHIATLRLQLFASMCGSAIVRAG